MTEHKGDHHATIEALFAESRTFPPPAEFVNSATLADPAIYHEANADTEAFWAKHAESLSWFRKWDQVLEWDPPFAKWFLGGTLNVAYNCLDRHVEAGRGDKVAFHWEGEPGDRKSITYAELLVEVSKTANALKELGVKKGDRVAVYMPMILEAPIALLACARIGAPHTMVFGGFSAESLRDRINDAECTVVITADGGYRRGAAAALKPNVDAALEGAPSVQKVLVAKRTGEVVTMVDGRDVWWDEIVARQSDDCPPE
ncbi:MAG: AMP-binding protein, partial [Chloroflexota bacterium]|nr:AMP-binding protein [Chloroflexota bacterium]